MRPASAAQQVQRLAGETDVERFIPSVLPWVHEAGNPYFDWFFGGEQTARAVLDGWMRRTSSEVAVQRVTVLTDGAKTAGGFLAVSGEELGHCRRADIVATLKERIPGLRDRLVAARGLFTPVEPDEFYLSKMGVALEFRSRGLGRRLIDEYLNAGQAAGFERFRLDVSADNRRAVDLYRRAGFRVDARRDCAGMTYVAMTLEL